MSGNDAIDIQSSFRGPGGSIILCDFSRNLENYPIFCMDQAKSIHIANCFQKSTTLPHTSHLFRRCPLPRMHPFEDEGITTDDE